MLKIKLYTDGSYCPTTNRIGWSFLALNFNDEIIHQNAGIVDELGEIQTGRQIGGEIYGVVKGVEFCRLNKLTAIIYYDYVGLFKWVSDFFGDDSNWRVNKEYTKKYRSFVFDNLDYIDKFEKVKGHSNDKNNDLADALAKKSLGLKIR